MFMAGLGLCQMIPTVLLPALLIGRWWVVPILALGWAVIVGGDCDASCRVAAAGLAALNALVAVGVHQVVRKLIQRVRKPE